MKHFTRRTCATCDHYCVFYIHTDDFYEKQDYMERLDIGFCCKHEHVALQDKFCRNWSNKLLRNSVGTFTRAVNLESLMLSTSEIKKILQEQAEEPEKTEPPTLPTP